MFGLVQGRFLLSPMTQAQISFSKQAFMYCNHYELFSFCGNNPQLDFRINKNSKHLLVKPKVIWN